MSLVAAVENLIKREKTSPSRVKKENKSSSEILSELFGVFNATPPEIREDEERKSKRAKKEKKHKKEKKRSRRDSSSDSERRHKKKKKKSKRHRSSASSLSLSPSRSRSRERKPKLERVKHEHVKSESKFKAETVKSEPDVKHEQENGESKTHIRRISTKEDDKNFQILIKSEDISKIPLPDSPQLSSNDLRLTLDSKHADKQADVDSDKNKGSSKASKGIQIKNLKFSAVFEETVKKAEEEARKKAELCEEGEYTDSSSNSRAPSVDNSSQFPKTNDPGGLKKKGGDGKRSSRERGRSERKRSSDRYHSSRKRSRDRSRSRRRSRSRSHHRSRSRDHRKSSRRARRSRSGSRSPSRSYTRPFSRRHNNLKLGPRKSRSPGVRLADTEKKRLLEVARKNAINMLKNGAVPAAAAALPPHTRHQVMAAIQSGGKSVDELTDFCKHLSKKEALGELSSVSSGDSGSDNEDTQAFHHPFLVKEKAPIVMNIRGGAPLPVKSGPLAIQNKEELRMQFPVSSGTQHRGSENDWRPVTPPSSKDNQIAKLNHKHPPKSTSTTPAPVPTTGPLALAAPPPLPPPPELPAAMRTFVGGNPLSCVPLPVPGPQAYPPGVAPPAQPPADITSLVSQKLLALRQQSERDLIPAATGLGLRGTSRLGAFTGSTLANILTPKELASGNQAWAKKDQLTRAAPVAGGMGMHLLQKMGWTPGKGLGKEETGTLQPLLLEVKLDTKGLQAKEEQKKPPRGGRRAAQANLSSTLSGVSGKHPVSLLGEYCTKRKLGPPEYDLCFECGPDHKKNFLFKVRVAGVEYQPSVASANKKQAKADSAQIALQKLGVLP